MGKAAQRKRERAALAAAVPDPGAGGLHGTRVRTITYSCGANYGDPLPVVLNFKLDGQMVFPSRWKVSDARNIANTLLKYCELVEREDRRLAGLPL